MLAYYIGPMLVMVCGCGAEMPPMQMVNNSSLSSELFDEVIATTEAVAGDAIDLSGWTLNVHSAVGEGCTGAAACSNMGLKTINIPAPESADIGTIAGVLCHELGHVWFYQQTGDSDHDHEHMTQWFGYNIEGSVCYRVADLIIAAN